MNSFVLFVNFLKKRTSIILISLIVFLAIYGLRLININVGIDTDERLYANLDNFYISIGRWFGVFLYNLWSLKCFNLYFANFLTYVLLFLSPYIWLFVFNNQTDEYNKKNYIAELLFICIYLCSVVWIELLYFTALSVEFAFAIFISPIAVSLLKYEFNIKSIIAFIILFICGYGVYQAFLFITIAGIIIYTINNFNYKDDKDLLKFVVKCILLIVLSLAIVKIANFIILYLLNIKQGTYVSNMISSPFDAFKDVKNIVKRVGKIILFLIVNVPVISNIMDTLVLHFANSGANAVAYYHNYNFPDANPYNLIIILLFVYIIFRKKDTILLKIIKLSIIVFAFSLYLFGNPPIRSHWHFPLIFGFLVYYVLKELKEKKVIFLLLCVYLTISLFFQIQYSSLLTYCDQLRYDFDKELAYNINRDVNNYLNENEMENNGNLKMYIVGRTSVPYKYNYKAGEVIGHSLFEWTFGSDKYDITYRGVSFMNFLGYSFIPCKDGDIDYEGVRQEIDNMPVYLKGDYIKIYDDVVVVKLSERVYKN